ncbi:(2Fe-2S) ferredoxin domain-containing protein [Synechococcus sp. GFB01]|uniref:(2Fe-2S) ferredoxin domain-containing protein n=1 Tax=Synechococcus sp. GFB01 TaxID=1662190 RepID=UPI000A9B5CDD|nr:(2Fe-2S) ferredoxin domain-containing protein [Synechococcus sp. GFB01]
MEWRRLVPADRDELIAVYRDAVLSQAAGLYRPEQVQAWAHHAGRDPQALRCLEQGYGIASLAGAAIEAFGILDPPAGDHGRLALLYCRGRSCRQGRATAILERLEAEARRQAVACCAPRPASCRGRCWSGTGGRWSGRSG